MSKRSLHASSAGIKEAKKAFASKGWTQEALALEVNLKTRQPIWRFFTGQPVERYTFMEICSILQLDWRTIAQDPPAEIVDLGSRIETFPVSDIDQIVRNIRRLRFDRVYNQCGTLKLLDVNRPVSMNDVYIDLNILEEIRSRQWLEISLLKNTTLGEFERLGLGDVIVAQVPGTQAIEKYPKVRILGKPGAGKTTFLQHLAIQCNKNLFLPNLIPLFISLRDFASSIVQDKSPNLLKYIQDEFTACEIAYDAEPLLRDGLFLLLLDGLDEVLEKDAHEVINEIRLFIDRYDKNIYVLSCRTAFRGFSFKGFVDVEIAPFTQMQINSFAFKWFPGLTRSANDLAVTKAQQLINNLDLPENQKFRSLVVTPLFLHLACSIFAAREVFPIKESEFYKQCLDILLLRWDESRGLERDPLYQSLRLPQKIKLLSQIAYKTFEDGHYFFTQNTIEQYITQFMSHLLKSSSDPEELQAQSETIFKSIELHNGIFVERAQGVFSFSYLPFHEYLTARKIVADFNLKGSEEPLKVLVEHISDIRWHEIFLLVASMLKSADSLVRLMKKYIDALVSQEQYIQKFLLWASQRATHTQSLNKLSAGRAFYFSLIKHPTLATQFALASSLDQGILLDLGLDTLGLECVMDINGSNRIPKCSQALKDTLNIVNDIRLKQILQQLKDELPSVIITQAQFASWWVENYLNWMYKLDGAIAQFRNQEGDWKFTFDQEKILQSYYEANQLLIICMNSASEISPSVRKGIEDTLLLPYTELEETEWQA